MNIIEESYKWQKGLERRNSTRYIILHHRAGCGSVQSIHSEHLARGWSGIGYHFYVRRDGTVYRGRPLDTVGAHCTGKNSVSVGVCFEGNYQADRIMPSEQLRSGRELVAYLQKIYPHAEIKGHRDFYATACPGRNFPFDEIVKGANAVKNGKKELTSANDITWELSQMIHIDDIDGFVRALDAAKSENSPLYWGIRKIVNR